MYGLLFESSHLVSKQLQSPSLVMARAIPLIRAQIARIRQFPLRFDELWNDAVKSLSSLQQADMHKATSLTRQTRSNRKCIQKPNLRMEFVKACNAVADDMEARFGPSDHDIIAQGLQSLVPNSETKSDTLLDPLNVLPFARLFRITTNESLLSAQLLTARGLIESDKPVIHSVMELGDYLLPLRMAFSLVLHCIAVAITIPVSSCSAERCFSAVKRIMTRLRTSMSDERLSDLTMLSSHR